MSPEDGWSLDPQLECDSAAIGDLALCQLRLMNDSKYPWLLLVPRRRAVTEIIDLAEADRAQLMREIAHTADTLKSETRCDKINVAAIGNVVAQLHVHVIARFRTDPAWPKPVWGFAPARAYDVSGRQKLVGAMRDRLIGK